jgi:NTE family protein
MENWIVRAFTTYQNQSPWPADAVIGMIVQTAFGPVIVGGTYGTTGHRKYFFQVGHVF